MHSNGLRLALVAAVGCCFATSAWGQAILRSVEVSRLGNATEIRIQGDRLAKPVANTAFGGKSLTYDFQATYTGKEKKIAVGKNGLEFVHLSALDSKPGKARVHLRFDKAAGKIEPTQSANGWVIRLADPAPKPVAKEVVALKGPGAPTKTTTTGGNAQPMKNATPAAKTNPAPKPASNPPAAKPNPTPAASNSFPNRPPTLQDSDRNARQADRLVSLEFTNTEIVQIFRALGIQAGVNVVTSPDVTGKLTVSLDRVTVKEAMDLVCALSGLRYGKVGNTYIVTTAAKFAETMAQFTGQQEDAAETRVVPIYSGQGTQIKAAILRTMPPGSGAGRYEITLPSEEITLQQVQRVGGTPGNGQGGQGDATVVGTRATTGEGVSREVRDTYVVLIGPKSRLDAVQSAVERLDRQMCEALGIQVPETSLIVQETYEVKGGDAEALRKAIVGEQGRRLGNVELTATPPGSRSKQIISIKGRKNEVDQVIEALRQIDSSDETDTSEFLVYDVKFADPRSLREEVINAVPGLRASIPPASAGNPRLFESGMAARGATEVGAVATPPGAQAPPAAGPVGTEPGVRVEAAGALTGLSLPFRDLEPAAQPMRLILRGSSAQLEAAKRYLSIVDIAPKQLALELRVMELSKEDAIRAGIDWNIFTGGAVKILRLNNSQGSATNPPSNMVGIKFRDGDVAASLDKIATKNNLIARPNVRAIDGRETELFVGEVIRYIVSITSGQNGPSVQTAELPIGVRLAVLPRIGGDGSITMDLRPRVSALRGFLEVPNGGQLPQTTERIAQSTINIQSGDTIAIGGLIQDQDRKDASGIPLLMDLPLIGQLFRRTTTTRVRTEVVLFLTVRSIDSVADELEIEKDMTKPTTPPPAGGRN